MSKSIKYLVTFYSAGKPQYEAGKEYPEDANSERHVASGYAEIVGVKKLTKAEQAAADKAAAELAEPEAAAAVQAELVKTKAVEISGLDLAGFDALEDAEKAALLETAAVELSK